MRAEEAILFLVVAVLSLALVMAVVAPLLRQKRAAERDAGRPVPPEPVAAVGGPVCPSCHCQLSVGFRFCPFDGASLATEIPMAVAPSHEPAGEHVVLGPAGARKICPTCARRYRLDVAVCERDGASLVPVN